MNIQLRQSTTTATARACIGVGHVARLPSTKHLLQILVCATNTEKHSKYLYMQQILQILLPPSTATGSAALCSIASHCSAVQSKPESTQCNANESRLVQLWCLFYALVCTGVCLCGALVCTGVCLVHHWCVLVSVRQNLGFLKSKSCFLPDCCRPCPPS